MGVVVPDAHIHQMGLDKVTKRCKIGKEGLKYTMKCKVKGCKKTTKETMNCVCGDWKG